MTTLHRDARPERERSQIVFFRMALGRLHLAWKRHGGRRAAALALSRFPYHHSRLIRVVSDLRQWVPSSPDRPGVSVRRGTLDDLEAFRGNGEVSFQFHLDRFSGLRRFYLGYVDGQIAGILWICTPPAKSPYMTLLPLEAEIQESFVLPEFRRRGLYLALLHHAMHDLQQEGVERVYSHTDADNAASLGGKAKLGFVRAGVLDVLWVLGYRGLRFTPAPAPSPSEKDRAAVQAVQLLRPVTFREVTDGARWNRLLLQLPGHDLRQSYEWGEMRRELGWTPLRYAVFDGGTCVAAISMAARRVPGLGRSVLYASRGPAMHWKDPAAWEGVVMAARAAAEATDAIFLRLSPGQEEGDAQARELPTRHGFVPLDADWTTWNAPRIVMTLDVTGPERLLQAGLRARFRQYIAAAPRRGFTVRPAASDADLRAFHSSLASMGKDKGYPVRDVRHFNVIARHWLSSGNGILLMGEHGGRLLGGLLAVHFGGVAHLLYSAIDRNTPGARHHAGPALYWELVRWAKRTGCHTVDLGGTGTQFPPQPSDSGYGLYHFKRGFGAELRHTAAYYDLVFRPAFYQPFRTLERTVLPRLWQMRA